MADTIPPIRFAPARGARLAYQQWGEGPDIVGVPATAQNIEAAWERPEIRAMLRRFGAFGRYIHFDKRGTGASDRSGRIADIDEQVDDLRAVMDHAGIDQAHLFGSSEGGPMTLLFAATYPDRVLTLTLFGTAAKMRPDDRTATEETEAATARRRFADVWGTDESPVAEGFAPSLAAADPSFVTWHRRYERTAASRDSLHELLQLAEHTDVRDILPDVPMPVLMIHRTDDRVVPVRYARQTAAELPNCRLLEQPGADHFAYAGDVDGWMDEMERFITGVVRSPPVKTVTGPVVDVATLGRFVVTVDGDEVPTSAWGSRRSRTLLQRLVAARGWPVTRDELCDLFWPEEADREILGARLSVLLSAVRRVLHGGVIADRQTVRLDLDAVTTDLERFYNAPDDEAVVAAYAGEFLAGDRYDDWASGPRDEARSRFVMAARRLAETASRAGDTGRALTLGRRLIDSDPYDEAAHHLVVTVLLNAGEDAQARRAHDRWTQTLGELGIDVPAFDEVADLRS